jgi:sugar lactone lactonase YvrE
MFVVAKLNGKMPKKSFKANSQSKIIVKDATYKSETMTLVRPSPLRGCNGIIFGLDGALYVCQGAVNTISRVELYAKEPCITTFVSPYHGIFYPDDVTVDDKGNFYAVGHISGEVYKINSKGMKKVIARNLNGPDGICYDKQRGRLFVSECFWGNRVFELDPEGKKEPRLITDTLSIPEAFDIKDGKLIIPDMGTGKIVKVDPDAGEIFLICEGLTTPVALKIGPDGYIYTIEQATGRVLKISPDGQHVETITVLAPGVDNLAFSPDGRLFVSSYHDSTIWEVKLDKNGKHEMIFPMGLNVPVSIVVKSERIYISDVVMVRMIDERGNLNKTRANPWIGTGYPLPITMTEGLGNNLITADFIDNIVVTVNPETGDWAPIAKLITPAGMTLDQKRKKLYVAEYSLGQITEVDLETPYPCKTRLVTNELSGPVALVAKDGCLYVAEALAGRISKVDVANGDKEIFLAGYVGKPKNLAWDYNCNLLVLDVARKELVKVDMNNLRLSIIASNLPVLHTTYYHHPIKYDGTVGLAVDDQGNIIIGGNEDGSITKIFRK